MNKKYYFVNSLARFYERPYLPQTMVTIKHPLQWAADLNESVEHSETIVTNWQEITKEEYDLFRQLNDCEGDEEESAEDEQPITKQWLKQNNFIEFDDGAKQEYTLTIDEQLSIEVCFNHNGMQVILITTNENDDDNINLASFTTYKYLPNIQKQEQLKALYSTLTINGTLT